MSKEEELEQRKAEASYQEFMHENLQDADIEKNLDNIIEEQMKKGKTDADILKHLGSVVGLGDKEPTRSEVEKKEKAEMARLTKKLKKDG